MSVHSAKRKGVIVAKFRRNEKDCGSPEVQVALITDRIEYLSKHFEGHPKDHHSRRGMLRLVSQRKDLLAYLKSAKPEAYKNVISTLGLRK